MELRFMKIYRQFFWVFIKVKIGFHILIANHFEQGQMKPDFL